MARYQGDPRWLTANWSGNCDKCGERFGKGESIFYYPNGKRALSRQCAREAAANFACSAQDDVFYCGE